MAMDGQWKVEILRQLRLRNQRETSGFTELIASYGKLQEQVESMRREILRLEYQKNELDKQVEELEKDGGSGGNHGGGGAQLGKANKKIDELQQKLMQKMEEQVKTQLKHSEQQEKVANLMAQLRSKEEELTKKESKIRDSTTALRRAEEKAEELQAYISSSSRVHQTLTDEHHALQLVFNSMEKKLHDTERENDRLRSNLMAVKARDADRLNEENESFRKTREKKLEEELRRASEEKDPPLLRSRTSSGEGRLKGRKGSTTSTSSSDTKVPDELPGPSICPASVLHAFDAHDNEVSALCFNHEGNYMATGGADKVVKVWSWNSPQEKMEPKCTLHGSSASIMSVQFDQLSKLVLAASNDYATRIWTFHDQRPKHTLTGHSNKVMAARFLEDNQKVVTGSHDRTLKIWDLHHKTCSKTLFAGSSCNDVVAGRGMGNTIISAHFDKRIRFWDMRSATANEIALQGKVTSLDHFPERHLLLCCSRDDTLRLIDLRQNSITATFSANGFHVSVDWTRACFSPDGQYVAAGSSDGTLFIWETFTGKVKSKKEHGKEIVTCSWHPKGQLFASADRNKKVMLWKR